MINRMKGIGRRGKERTEKTSCRRERAGMMNVVKKKGERERLLTRRDSIGLKKDNVNKKRQYQICSST